MLTSTVQLILSLYTRAYIVAVYILACASVVYTARPFYRRGLVTFGQARRVYA